MADRSEEGEPRGLGVAPDDVLAAKYTEQLVEFLRALPRASVQAAPELAPVVR